MSVESIRQAAKAGIDECPAKALHDTGCEGMEAFDDVSGQPLDPALMIKARKLEIEYFRDLGVYEKVDVKKCLTSKPCSTVGGSDCRRGSHTISPPSDIWHC